MIIEKLVIKNFKMFKHVVIGFNEGVNTIVGDNDSGKSTVLEALNLVLSGKLYNSNIQNVLNLGLFNAETRNDFIKLLAKNTGEIKELPAIEIEAYLKLCEDDSKYKNFRGSNNSLKEDAYGIKLEIAFNSDNSNTLRDLIKNKELTDIPLELYHIVYRSFATSDYYISKISKLSMFIDATRRDYSGVLNKFISLNFISNLSETDIAALRLAYKGNKENFVNNGSVVALNKKINEDIKFKDFNLSINLRDSEIDAWKDDVEFKLNNISISNMGFGTQNMFKTQLVTQDNDDVDILLLEEPENSLSFSNMSILISKISECSYKQIFIATHSSFVANKLGLQNLLLISKGVINRFNALDEHSYKYFMALPGYNTLRLLLAEKTVLVEGPADELIIQRAYLDKNGHLPIQDGIDVLSVGGIAFKNYCHLAQIVKKKVVVVTDNDGNINKKDDFLIFGETVKFCMESDKTLKTLEPCVLSANKDSFESFKKIVYLGNDIDDVDYQGLLDFMKNNKTAWSLRIFESEEKINYPRYILDAISDE